MSSRFLLKAVAIALIAAAVVAGAMFAVRSFSFTLRMAVPPLPKDVQTSVQNLSREMLGERGWITLAKVPVADPAAAAKALTAGDVDIALVRTDIALPAQAQTLAILRRDKLFLIVPAQSDIESFRDLENHAVGILPGPVHNDALLSSILAFFGVPAASVARVPLAPQDVGAALKQKTIAAVYVVGQPGVGAASEAFASVSRAMRAAPDIVGVDDGVALSKRIVTLDTAEIAQGAFGGPKPKPEEDTATLAVAYRLVATPAMSSMVAGELTRRLFAAKSRLLAENPLLADIEAPDTEQTTFAIHPGARAYLDGQQPSVFDRFESLFWIGSAALGVFGSAITWVIAKLRGRADAGARGLDRLIAFLGEVRKADRAQLDALKAELDEVVTRLLEARQAGDIEDAEFTTVQAAISYARQAIEDRGAALLAQARPG